MVDVAMTFGALLIGGILATLFSGVTWAQCVVYLKMYPNDQWGVRTLVFGVWLLDTLHTFFISQSLWNYLIVDFGHAEGIDDIPTSLALTIVATAALTYTVHLFFIYRVFILSKNNYYITTPVLALASARLCFACLTTARLIQLRSLHRFVQLFSWSFTTGLTLSAIVDVLITGFMCFFLRRRRGQYSSLNKVLDTLILYAFENGILTTVAALLSLITWLTMKHNLIFMATHFIIIKFYANSLLATLNARRDLKPGGITMHTTNLRSMSGMATQNEYMGSRHIAQPIVLGEGGFQQSDSEAGYDAKLEEAVTRDGDFPKEPKLRIAVKTTSVSVTDSILRKENGSANV